MRETIDGNENEQLSITIPFASLKFIWENAHFWLLLRIKNQCFPKNWPESIAPGDEKEYASSSSIAWSQHCLLIDTQLQKFVGSNFPFHVLNRHHLLCELIFIISITWNNIRRKIALKPRTYSSFTLGWGGKYLSDHFDCIYQGKVEARKSGTEEASSM
jgi:hypothetical protein